MRKLDKIHCIDDFRHRARANLPRFAFEFIDGGSGIESALTRNEAEYQKIQLIPRVGKDLRNLHTETEVFGKSYSLPIGIAPIGLCGIVHPKADIQLAKIAKKYRLPYIASTTSNTSIEDIAEAIGEAPWFQLYASKSTEKTTDLIQRVKNIGSQVLVVTVDTACPGKRLRDLRNRLTVPFRPSVLSVLDVAKHPLWVYRRLLAGKINFPNLPSLNNEEYNGTLSELMAWQTGGGLDWDALRELREIWPRKMVLKGILSPEDAKIAISIGVDAVIVSNHGGRQLDCAPAPIEQLPEFIAQGLERDFLFVDSGVRSGEDVAKALALGANFTFLGRPFIFALAAAGSEGGERLISILRDEVRIAMSLLGATTTSALSEVNFRQSSNRLRSQYP